MVETTIIEGTREFKYSKCWLTVWRNNFSNVLRLIIHVEDLKTHHTVINVGVPDIVDHHQVILVNQDSILFKELINLPPEECTVTTFRIKFSGSNLFNVKSALEQTQEIYKDFWTVIEEDGAILSYL